MKKSKIIPGMVLLGITLLTLTGCNIFDDLLGTKDFGQYTSITFQIIATYGGVNSEGIHKLSINNNVLNNAYFVFDTTSGCDESCSGAIYENPITLTATINATTCTATQQYIDWIYWKYNNNSNNCKCLVTSYQASIIDYTFEEGKDDPGTPIINGLDQLETFENCTGTFSTDCETSVTLNFSSPNQSGAKKSSAAVVVVRKQVCSPEPINK